jgi:hypothetical protein
MSQTISARRAGWPALGVVAVLAAAGAILARWTSPASATGLATVTAGVAAVLFLGFPGNELARAIACAAGAGLGERRRAALVWQLAAWSAWVLSAASAVAGFVTAFAAESGGLARFLAGVGDRTVGVAAGLLLAVLLAVPALRLAGSEGTAAGPGSSPAAWQRLLAGLVLLALFAAPVFGRGSGGRFEPLPWLLHGPAWLVVLGGALALALYLRDLGRGTAAVLGLTAAGTVGIILGLARGLHGFATVSIEDVAGGLMFAISSGYAALAGLAGVGLPLVAGDLREGRRAPGAVRTAVLSFPVVVALLLAVTILLAVVPMEKPGG